MPASTPFLGLYKPGGGSSGLITPDEVVDIDRLNGNSDAIDQFALSTDTALKELLKKGRTAVIAKRNGFQAIPLGGAVVSGMAQVILTDGYDFASGTGILTVKDDGLYQVTVNLYGSGGDLNALNCGFNMTATSPKVYTLPVARLKRADVGIDMTVSATAVISLAAGATLRLVAAPSAGAPSIYGSADNAGDGTSFSVVRLGPTSM